VNDFDDKGGETNYGISKRAFPNEDIKNMTVARAKVLYYNYYWLPMNLDGLSDEAALEIFDFGVNAGRWRAVRTAQNLVGVRADGVVGPITKKAINEFDDFVAKYKQCRKVFYEHIAAKRNNQKFLRGWLRRVDNTRFDYV
jgi:lysozyme family protein